MTDGREDRPSPGADRRPRGPHDPDRVRPSWSIRQARPADLPELVSLERACFTPAWSERLLRVELEAPASLFLVAAGGEPPSLLGSAVFRTVADESELLRIAVRAESRRGGLGRALVEAGLAKVARRGAVRCFLEVRRDNAAAIALYRALGFSVSGERPGYYSDGTDALVMARRWAAAEP